MKQTLVQSVTEGFKTNEAQDTDVNIKDVNAFGKFLATVKMDDNSIDKYYNAALKAETGKDPKASVEFLNYTLLCSNSLRLVITLNGAEVTTSSMGTEELGTVRLGYMVKGGWYLIS